MKLVGYKSIDDHTVIEYFDDGRKLEVKRLDGGKPALVGSPVIFKDMNSYRYTDNQKSGGNQ